MHCTGVKAASKAFLHCPLGSSHSSPPPKTVNPAPSTTPWVTMWKDSTLVKLEQLFIRRTARTLLTHTQTQLIAVFFQHLFAFPFSPPNPFSQLVLVPCRLFLMLCFKGISPLKENTNYNLFEALCTYKLSCNTISRKPAASVLHVPVLEYANL